MSVKQEFADDAKVDSSVKFFGDGTIHLGLNSRIDAFCVITVGPEGVWIGDNVHIGVGACIFGGAGKVAIGNGCSLSPRSTIYTAIDVFGTKGSIGPQHPASERNVCSGDVTMEDESALGHGAVMFPNTSIPKGSAIGALVIYAPCDSKEMQPGELLTTIPHQVQTKKVRR
jgi:galactoside O-acetyltransferase